MRRDEIFFSAALALLPKGLPVLIGLVQGYQVGRRALEKTLFFWVSSLISTHREVPPPDTERERNELPFEFENRMMLPINPNKFPPSVYTKPARVDFPPIEVSVLKDSALKIASAGACGTLEMSALHPVDTAAKRLMVHKSPLYSFCLLYTSPSPRDRG